MPLGRSATAAAATGKGAVSIAAVKGCAVIGEAESTTSAGAWTIATGGSEDAGLATLRCGKLAGAAMALAVAGRTSSASLEFAVDPASTMRVAASGTAEVVTTVVVGSG
ncbi:MAG: hypothetical protein WCF68_06205 [Terriglobales bacterium]